VYLGKGGGGVGGKEDNHPGVFKVEHGPVLNRVSLDRGYPVRMVIDDDDDDETITG